MLILLNISRLTLACAIAVALAAPSAGAVANEAINENPMTASAKFAPERTAPGGTTELRIEMQLAKGHHAYVDRFKVAIDSPDGLKIDSLRITPQLRFKDTVSGAMKAGVENAATLLATVEVPASFTAGASEAQIRFVYQACTPEHCLFPKTLDLRASLIVGSADAGLKSIGTVVPPKISPTVIAASDFSYALGRGTGSALFFVFIVGFLTSLTPCVYPMIPITLAVLGARTQGQSQLRSFLLSAAYVLGIATTYSALGVAAASTGALFGSALSNVYVVTAIALIFVVMALSMYGLFELQVPARLRNRLGNGQAPAGFFGAYLTGLIAGVVASPCVGPVLVGVLAYIAQTRDRFLGFIFLFTFACGMGVLFMALGAFSQLIKRVPKSGAWMESTKFVFGTTMVGMALYYVEPIYPAWLFRALLASALIALSSAFGAFEPNSGLTPRGRLRKGAMIAIFIVGAALAVASALERFVGGIGVSLSASTNSEIAKLDWKPFTDEALTAAASSHLPVIIDFSADWCAACKELERFTFSDARVREKSRAFTLLTVDATNESPALTALQKRFAVAGLPQLIFYDSSGVQRPELALSGFENADSFLARMERAAIK